MRRAAFDVFLFYAAASALFNWFCHKIRPPILLAGFFLAADSLLGSLTRTRVLLGMLSAYGKALTVTNTAIAADFNKTLDIQRNLTTKVTLYLNVLVNIISD